MQCLAAAVLRGVAEQMVCAERLCAVPLATHHALLLVASCGCGIESSVQHLYSSYNTSSPQHACMIHCTLRCKYCAHELARCVPVG